jgi:hypothetical protein
MDAISTDSQHRYEIVFLNPIISAVVKVHSSIVKFDITPVLSPSIYIQKLPIFEVQPIYGSVHNQPHVSACNKFPSSLQYLKFGLILLLVLVSVHAHDTPKGMQKIHQQAT